MKDDCMYIKTFLLTLISHDIKDITERLYDVNMHYVNEVLKYIHRMLVIVMNYDKYKYTNCYREYLQLFYDKRSALHEHIYEYLQRNMSEESIKEFNSTLFALDKHNLDLRVALNNYILSLDLLLRCLNLDVQLYL